MESKDPQIIVQGTLKEREKGDLITFSIRLGFFEVVCIVNIPEEGSTTAPVYVKYKIARSRPPQDKEREQQHETDEAAE